MSTTSPPLVSIVIITYNSSKYVLETLESAKAQTYQNIELIITDDCSTDNTVELCKEWIIKNGSRFVRSEVITIPKNTGISANCNRGLAVAHGEWIKYIAGDDILLATCIELYSEYVLNKPDISFLFSDLEFISERSEVIVPPSWYSISHDKFLLTPEQQYKELVVNGNFVLAPTSFINRVDLVKLNGFDERIPNEEDYSLWIKATKSNIKLHYLAVKTVKYRINENGITNSNSFIFKQSRYRNFIYYRSGYLFTTNIFQWYNLLVIYFVQTRKCKLYRLLKYTSLLYLIRKIKR